LPAQKKTDAAADDAILTTMSSTAPASFRKGDQGQRGSGRGRGGSHLCYWGGRGGRGGRGRGGRDRGGAGRGGAGRGRAEPSKAHGGEEIDSNTNDSMKVPQDRSETMYNESMTAMLKKQLGLGNDDSVAPTNVESGNPAPSAAVTTATAIVDTSKQRRDDKRQRNTARGKPNQNQKRPKPKNTNQEGKESSHHDNHPRRLRHPDHAPSVELVLPPSTYDDQVTLNCNGKKYSNSNHRTRPKPNQKNHSKKSTQPGKENVCSQDSNEKQSSTTSYLSNHDVIDTPIISKSKKKKPAKSSNKQGKESQKKNQPNKSLDSTKVFPPADHGVVSTDTHPKPKKEKLSMMPRTKYGKRGQKNNQPNKCSESDSSKTFPPADHDDMNTATCLESKKEKPTTESPDSQGKENQKDNQRKKSSDSESTKAFPSAKDDVMNANTRPKSKKEKPATNSTNKQGKGSQKKIQPNKFSDVDLIKDFPSAKHDVMNTHARPKSKKKKPVKKPANKQGKASQEKTKLNKSSNLDSTKTFQLVEHDVADTATRPEPKKEKPATKPANKQEKASQEKTQPNKSSDSDSTKNVLPAEHDVADITTRPGPKQEKIVMSSLTQQGKEKNELPKLSDSTKTSPSQNRHVLDTGTATINTTPMQLERGNEKERMNRLLEEEREKLAAAKEKKKSKRSKKHDRWIKEQAFEKSKRAKSW